MSALLAEEVGTLRDPITCSNFHRNGGWVGELGFEPIIFTFNSHHATLEEPNERNGHSM